MNTYLDQDPSKIKLPLVLQVTRFIFHILKCFGLYEEADFPSVSGGGEQSASGNSQSYEEMITPVVNALVNYRTQVIQNAKGDGKELFALSDQLRDQILPLLGIQIEDKGAGQ